MPIRQIVRDAFQVDELVHQFTVLDVEDGLLQTGSEKEVNENKDYSDRYIIEEAQNRLKLLEKQITKLDEEHEDDSTYRIELQFLEQEKNQLQLFLKKWGPQKYLKANLKKFFYSFTANTHNKQQINAVPHTLFWLSVVKKYAKLKISANAIYLSIVGAILK